MFNIFEILYVLIKFLTQKWTLMAKKWRFIRLQTWWRSNQEIFLHSLPLFSTY